MLSKAIRIILSLILLFGMLYLGKFMAFLVPIGIPDSIWGMLILFACLVIGVIKVEWITSSARPLTRYMTLFFLPICAELIEHFALLRHNLDVLVLSTVFSSALSLILIALFAQWIFHRHRG